MIQLMDVPDSEEEGVTGCRPWMDSYPINNGLVFGGVGTSGGYALDDGTSEGLSLSYSSATTTITVGDVTSQIPSTGPLLEVIACGGVTINADGSQEIVSTCFGIYPAEEDRLLCKTRSKV